MKFRLFHYWRSSSSWRVRWALAVKKQNPEFIPVNLLTDESDQPAHLARNPVGYVPVLEVLRAEHPSTFLSESIAIIEFLEESFPQNPLFSGDPLQRARIRQLCQIINSDTQPLHNPNVVEKLSQEPGQKLEWNQFWIRRGLSAYETLLTSATKAPAPVKFSVGDTVTAADLCLIPQCYSAIRNEISLSEFPKIEQIYQYCLTLDECKASAPDIFKPKP